MSLKILLTLLLACLSSSWVLAQMPEHRIKPREQAREINFGRDIAFHGDSLLISVPFRDIGRVIEIYTKGPDEWEYVDSIRPANPVESNGFGAVFEVIDDHLYARAQEGIYVFEYVSGQWTEMQLLSIPDSLDFSSGSGMYVRENALFFQAVRPTGQFNEGAVLHFAKSNGTWALEQVIQPAEPGERDAFGSPICLAGNSLMVGASRDPVIGEHSGSVYVFDREGETWSQSQKLIPGDAAFADQFGRGLACFNDRIVVHSYSRGKTYTFEKNR